MSDNKKLKPGWKVWRFEQMATNVNVRIDNPSESGMEHFIGLEHLDADSLKIRRWGAPSDVEATKLMFKTGDIIFGRRRAYQRKLGVAEFDGICSAHAMVLRAKPDVVIPEFLPFFMQGDLFMNRAVEISVGSLSPTINWKTMAVQEFAVPPMDEQHRLVKLLRAIEHERNSLLEAKAASDALVSSIGKDVLENNPALRADVGTLAKFASGDGIAVSLLSGSPTLEASVPVYGGNGVAGYTATPLNKLPQETVVIGRVGAYCGRTYFVEGDAWISDNALFTTFISDAVLPKYLAICLVAANLNRLSTGGAQPLINQQIVKSIKIPVPEIHEQKEIVESLESISHKRIAFLQRSDGLQELKQMVLRGVRSV